MNTSPCRSFQGSVSAILRRRQLGLGLKPFWTGIDGLQHLAALDMMVFVGVWPILTHWRWTQHLQHIEGSPCQVACWFAVGKGLTPYIGIRHDTTKWDMSQNGNLMLKIMVSHWVWGNPFSTKWFVSVYHQHIERTALVSWVICKTCRSFARVEKFKRDALAKADQDCRNKENAQLESVEMMS